MSKMHSFALGARDIINGRTDGWITALLNVSTVTSSVREGGIRTKMEKWLAVRLGDKNSTDSLLIMCNDFVYCFFT